MKALSVLQPFAWLIAAGHKTVENRTWNSYHRGPLQIHAGKSNRLLQGLEGVDLVTKLAHRIGMTSDALADELEYGKILGQVELEIVCRPLELAAIDREKIHEFWIEGPWCWVMSNAKLFEEPIPFRGQVGVFNVPGIEGQ